MRFNSRDTFVTYGLIAVCAFMFILLTFAGGSSNVRTLVRFGASVTDLVQDRGEYWRLFTCMFLHSGVMHILFNSYALLALGRQAEILFGHGRFLIIYFGAGLCGSWLSFFLHRHETMVSVGASGAVFGVLGALIAYGWRDRAFWRSGILQNFLIIAAINLFIGIMMPRIDNSAHLGGLIAGIILGALLRRRIFPPIRRVDWSNDWGDDR
ncbi:MAG: rhomboid family intramembrane serine protease [Gracilibacteraceae bacterium]|jgi:rhomboid protease GluP|nr:rhomboid family intramembrane serine protease [Gracilibacteraceae bacterium]